MDGVAVHAGARTEKDADAINAALGLKLEFLE